MNLTPLLHIARQGIPFTAADGQAFVRLPVPSSGGFYILPVRSPAFRDWFFYRFFNQHETLPSANAFHALLNHLEAQANQNEDYQRLAVFRRVGSRGPAPFYNQILLDLDDSDRRFVEISPNSWRITAGANALLQTSRSSASLPEPVPAPGSASSAPLQALRSCLNLSGRSDWLRCLAWLLAALRPDGPFPFLILQGPPGSGKTLAARLLRCLIDPCASPLSPNPSSARDLIPLARHNWILAFDHVSTLPLPLASALCRLSSGLGAAVSETSRVASEPLLQYFKRPVLHTAAGSWSCPPDLAERALIVNFPALPPACRRSEAALLMEFNQALPSVLGALCSAVGAALARLPRMNLPEGRRPDALAWAIAAAPSLDATDEELRHAFAPPEPPDLLVESIRAFVRRRGPWTGSAAQLLRLLSPAISCGAPKDLSKDLRARALALTDIGIDLDFRRAHRGSRIIELRAAGGDAESQPRERATPQVDLDEGPIVNRDADDCGRPSLASSGGAAWRALAFFIRIRRQYARQEARFSFSIRAVACTGRLRAHRVDLPKLDVVGLNLLSRSINHSISAGLDAIIKHQEIAVTTEDDNRVGSRTFRRTRCRATVAEYGHRRSP